MNDSNVRTYQYNGREYQIHKLPATKGVGLWNRLVRLFGDPLVRVVVTSVGISQAAQKTNGEAKPEEVPGEKPKEKEITPEQMKALAEHFLVFEKLKDDDLLSFMRLVFPYVVVNNAQIYKGNDQDIDRAFQGYELDVFPVFLEALRYNLGPFFEGFLKNLPPVFLPTPTGLQT